jgi:Holliday junction resolvase
MPHPSKRKGNRFERELVKAFEAAGLQAERAWGSNASRIYTPVCRGALVCRKNDVTALEITSGRSRWIVRPASLRCIASSSVATLGE